MIAILLRRIDSLKQFQVPARAQRLSSTNKLDFVVCPDEPLGAKVSSSLNLNS